MILKLKLALMRVWGVWKLNINRHLFVDAHRCHPVASQHCQRSRPPVSRKNESITLYHYRPITHHHEYAHFYACGGRLAYNRIPKEAEPDINIPNINVSTTLEGVSPVDAERLLVRPLEEEFKNLEAVKQISASAFQGGATISIEFEPGTNTDMVLQEVRNKVDMATTPNARRDGRAKSLRSEYVALPNDDHHAVRQFR